MSEPWGRWSEDIALSNARDIERLGGGVDSDGRVQNSSMDNMASQIVELYARQVQPRSASDITTPVFSGSNAESISTTITLPPPIDGDRVAQISASCSPLALTSVGSNVFITMRINGVDFYRDSLPLPPGAGTFPPGWNSSTAEGYVSLNVPQGSSLVVQFHLMAMGYALEPGNKQIRLSSISASVTYGQKI